MLSILSFLKESVINLTILFFSNPSINESIFNLLISLLFVVVGKAKILVFKYLSNSTKSEKGFVKNSFEN